MHDTSHVIESKASERMRGVQYVRRRAAGNIKRQGYSWTEYAKQGSIVYIVSRIINGMWTTPIEWEHSALYVDWYRCQYLGLCIRQYEAGCNVGESVIPSYS